MTLGAVGRAGLGLSRADLAMVIGVLLARTTSTLVMVRARISRLMVEDGYLGRKQV